MLLLHGRRAASVCMQKANLNLIDAGTNVTKFVCFSVPTLWGNSWGGLTSQPKVPYKRRFIRNLINRNKTPNMGKPGYCPQAKKQGYLTVLEI